MEAIKNILRPGNKEDDQTLYGQQGNTTNKSSHSSGGGLTGEGSHLAGNRDNTNTNTIGQSHGVTQDHSLSGQGSHLSGSNAHSNLQGGSTTSDNSRLGANDTLGSTAATGTGGAGTGAAHREYDPQGNASQRGISTIGGQGETYNDKNTTTVGPDSTDTTRTGSDNSRGQHSGGIGSAGGVGSTGAHSGSHANTTSGPHDSNLANRADPRVDSDNSRSTQSGLAGAAGAAGLAGAVGSSGTHSGSHATTTSGPHDSNLANRADPRVDSDNSRATGSGIGGSTGGYSSTTGGSYHTGPIGSAVGGPHQTSTANRLDPNLDSGAGHRENAIHHDTEHGGGAEKADHDHKDSRQAATAAGAGAVGLGAVGLASGSNESRFTNQGTSDVEREGHALDGSRTLPGAFPDSRSNSYTNTPTTTGGPTLGSNDNTGVLGSQHTSTIPDRTRGLNDSTTTSDKDHHYGRDAAVVGGATALAGGAYGASRHSDNTTSGTTHQEGNTVGDRLHSTEENRGATGTTGFLHGDEGVDRSHGIMTGTATGATTGNQSHSSNTIGTGLGAGQQTSHASTTNTTSGPHASDLANRADPRVDSDRSQESHHGRNAALGAGALGAAGAAGYGASRHHNDQEHGVRTNVGEEPSTLINRGHPLHDSSRTTESHHGSDALGAGAAGTGLGASHSLGNTASTTSGPHTSDTLNRADPRVDSDRSKEETHHGRNAALGAGALGAAGAAGYGASRHYDNNQAVTGNNASDLTHQGAGTSGLAHGTAGSHSTHPQTSTTTTTTTNTSTSTSGPHSSDLANRADPRVDSDRSKDKDHHVGRDAAVAGGAGTAAYAAHQNLDRDDEAEKARKRAEKEHHKEEKHAEKEHRKEEKHAEKHAEKHDDKADKHEKKEHKGLFSFLHRDKNKKYTKEEEEEFDRQERDRVRHEAAAKLAAGEAVVVAGSGAADAGHESHEHGSHDSHDKHNEKSLGSTIGDKLHGVERNRGVPGADPFPHGGGPKEGINEVTGQPFESSTLHGTHTIGTGSRNASVVGDHSTDQHGSVVGGAHPTGTHAHQHDTTGVSHGSAEHSRVGAFGAQENTARKPSLGDHNTDQDGQVYGGTSTTGQTGDLSSGHHERNRLHKDPPAGHPASGI